ncbi:MAG: NAD-glutamate dehydrogenase [Rhodospirillales bacterium]
MPRVTEIQKADQIDKVVEAAERRLGKDQAAPVTAFVRRYFAHLPPADIFGETADNLFGAALSHWRLAARRRPGTACVRVYNPRLDEHGWRCGHTVVEVVTDDMPFLVASLTAELNRRDLVVHLVNHPVLRIRRTADGGAVEIDDAEDAVRESFMHFQVTHQSGPALAEIASGIEGVLADVRAAVEDWQPMRARLSEIIEGLDASGGVAAEEVDEVRAFLQWVYEHHFTLLGYRAYRFEGEGAAATIGVEREAGLGLLRDPDFVVFDELRDLTSMPPAVRAFVAQPELLTVTKTNRKSTVHRPALMDFIAVKRFDADGRMVGLHSFVGLFTAVAYNRSPRDIPLLRRKLEHVIARAGFDARSHDGKALMNIVETFPRDELFQVSEDHLLETSVGILHLQDRRRVALFLRRDPFERFITCLVYIPNDRYSTELRRRIQAILERAFAGEVTSHYSQVGDAPHARLYLIVRTRPGSIPDYDATLLQAEIVAATRTWSDHLKDALISARGEEQGNQLFHRYSEAFEAGYQDRFNAEEAVEDVVRIEQTLATGDFGIALYRPFDAGDTRMRLKIYQPDSPVILSQALPLLEHLGLRVIDEMPHVVRLGGGDRRTVMIHDFGLELRSGATVELGAIRDNFEEAVRGVWRGELESDRFNGLVLDAGLSSREVTVVRAYCKYLRQAGIAFSESYMQQTLLDNPKLAGRLVALFKALFDPAGQGSAEDRAARIRAEIAAGLERVESADEDRIIRRFLNAVEATLRTNFFQRAADGGCKPYLSIKLDSRRLEDLPLPRPMVEVFVYSPRMEGIHLRGGKVARGGIRWSDRREDFRTEVLGLMKAQMVKNVVIVPVGSKGGFVVKRPPDPGDREAYLAEGVACYKTLIRGLLDITDNIVGNDVVPPADVVRRDDDDPYLVVAADKGTATFSDIANGVSAEYGFWLADAFASGGSHGYDHKRMGITARGAWECVKRHFREIGIDIQTQDFTVVGVGDMSGDVFGNGMLLSPHIRLLAAFNHLHIFLDPDPDAAAALAERQRLFDLPRSSWADYDRSLISTGGGIFDRRAKALRLSPEVRQRFGIEAATLTPAELIRALLRAEVDLLWFGGIGTYVKASGETHADVGDRANDALRVDGAALRCKVVGEGANLGVTQLGRIEYALAGGRVNTDFIDNSAGVDCSDHEVNIKILLNAAVADGDMTAKQRDALLVEMTDEVAQLVLRDNYLQSQAITQVEAEGLEALDNQSRLIRMLERQGRLDRAVEFLPDEEGIAERAAARQGLSRPEIAVLLSYCKLSLYDEFLASDLPDDRHLAEDVVRYFPSPLQSRFKERIFGHRLRRELIATSITNSLVNRVGGTFVAEIGDKSGMPTLEIARAYIISRDVFQVREAWERVESLDNRVPAAVQTTLQRETRRLIERGTLWFLRNGGSPLDIAASIATFAAPVAALAGRIDSVLVEDTNSRILHRAGRYREDGVPEDLARRIAYMIVLPSACDIVRIAAARGVDIEAVARLYFALGEFLGFGWLRYQAEKLVAGGHWQKLALAAVVEELYAHQHDVTLRVLDTAGMATDGAIETWTHACRPAVERSRALLGELATAAVVDLSMLTVASRQLGTLTYG